MTTCFHCLQEHPQGHYERVVQNKTPLHGPWSGWRMAGRFLVAPDRQRITPERLRGILWREELTKPRTKRAEIVRIGNHFGGGHGTQVPSTRAGLQLVVADRAGGVLRADGS